VGIEKNIEGGEKDLQETPIRLDAHLREQQGVELSRRLFRTLLRDIYDSSPRTVGGLFCVLVDGFRGDMFWGIRSRQMVSAHSISRREKSWKTHTSPV
jgi:hypothetical protein